MKVNGCDPVFPTNPQHDHYSGIPVRLEIAARILAAMNSSMEIVEASERLSQASGNSDNNFLAMAALAQADELIELHNKTCVEVTA